MVSMMVGAVMIVVTMGRSQALAGAADRVLIFFAAFIAAYGAYVLSFRAHSPAGFQRCPQGFAFLAGAFTKHALGHRGAEHQSGIAYFDPAGTVATALVAYLHLGAWRDAEGAKAGAYAPLPGNAVHPHPCSRGGIKQCTDVCGVHGLFP